MSEPQISSGVAAVNAHDLETVTLPDAHPPLCVRSFGLTDSGKVRATNEDQFLIAVLLKALQTKSSTPKPNPSRRAPAPLSPFPGQPRWEKEAMRNLSGSADPALPALHPLALILAGVAAPVWGVAGLTLGLTLLLLGVLVLALSSPLSLVLPPLVLASRSWPGWRWGWLCRPDWFLEPWSWLCRCWLRWPWLCWRRLC